MGSTRIKGSKLLLTMDGTDYWADAIKVELDNEEASGDVTTFEDAAAGGARQFFFTVTALQSTAASSFWRWLWENTGETVPAVYAPHGNAVATADQPHFEGSVTVGPKPKIGGEAGASTTYTFDYRLDCTAEPTLKTTA